MRYIVLKLNIMGYCSLIINKLQLLFVISEWHSSNMKIGSQ